VERAPDLEDFLAQPVGRYYAGAHHLIWSWSPSLAGSAIWGEPDERELGDVLRLLDFGRELPTPEGGIDVITDGARLTRFDPEGFRMVLAYARQRAPEFARRYRRHAIVHPSGMTAAVMAGILSLVGSTHASRMFADTESAFRWLDRPDGEAALREVNALLEAALGTSALVRELRQILDAELPRPALTQVARRLGRSVRALQRELEEAGTTFRAELEGVRIAAACQLLDETDLKLEVIALRVGCASLPVFSRLFRRCMGAAPSTWRARR
jgi:AraC-like DNA-binding protein